MGDEFFNHANNVTGENFANDYRSPLSHGNTISSNPRPSYEFNPTSTNNSDVAEEALIKTHRSWKYQKNNSSQEVASEAHIASTATSASSIGIIASLTTATVAVSIGITGIIVVNHSLKANFNILEATAHEIYYNVDISEFDGVGKIKLLAYQNNALNASVDILEGRNRGSFTNLTIGTNYQVKLIGYYDDGSKTYYSNTLTTNPISRFNYIDSDLSADFDEGTFDLALNYYDDFSYFSNFALTISDSDSDTITQEFLLEKTHNVQTISFDPSSFNLRNWAVKLSLSYKTNDPSAPDSITTLDSHDILHFDDDPYRFVEEEENSWKVWFTNANASHLDEFLCDWTITKDERMIFKATYTNNGTWYNPRFIIQDHNGKYTDYDFGLSDDWQDIGMTWFLSTTEGVGLDLFTGKSLFVFGFFSTESYEQYYWSMVAEEEDNEAIKVSDGFSIVYKNYVTFTQQNVSKVFSGSLSEDLYMGLLHIDIYYYDDNHYFSNFILNIDCGDKIYTHPLESTIAMQSIDISEEESFDMCATPPFLSVVVDSTRGGTSQKETIYTFEEVSFKEFGYFENVIIKDDAIYGDVMYVTFVYRGDITPWSNVTLSASQGSVVYTYPGVILTKEEQEVYMVGDGIDWTIGTAKLSINMTIRASDGSYYGTNPYNRDNVTLNIIAM